MATVDAEAIRQARLKLVLDYSFGTASFVMPNVLAKVGAEVLVYNPYANTKGVMRSTPGTPTRWPTWSGRRGRTSARCSTPAGNT